MRKQSDRKPHLVKLTEAELVEAARMHAASLSELHQEIVARGIEIDLNHYTSGRYETRYYRKTETDL